LIASAHRDFTKNFVETRTPPLDYPLNSEVSLEHLLPFKRPARRHEKKGRRRCSKAQAKTMYGDPFVSLVVAVLFAIVFYNHSSIPNGQSYDSQNMHDPRVRK
jgi:hypothetical protein